MTQRVIIVTHLDYPSAEGLSYRIHQMAKSLSSDYKVTVLAPILENKDSPIFEISDGYEIRRIAINVPKIIEDKRILFRAFFIVMFTALMVKIWGSLSKEKVKLIQAEQQLSLLPSLFLSYLLKTDLIVDDALGFKDYYADYPKSAKMAFWLFEMSLFHRCRMIICGSFNVAPSFQKVFNIPSSKIKVIPNGVNIANSQYKKPEKQDQEHKNIVFIASMYSAQNLRAVMNLVKIFAKISDVIKTARLFIIGGPTDLLGKKNLSSIQSISNVHLLGRVSEEEKKNYLQTADVCPMAFDPKDKLMGGIRLKSLECLAYGKVIVSTSTGIEGISGAINGLNLIITDDFNEFEHFLVDVLKSPESYEVLKANAFQLAKTYQWEAVLAPYLVIIKSI